MDEIPYHLSRLDISESESRWKEIWSDSGWLLTKLALSGVVQVIEDFALTPESLRPETLEHWLSMIAPTIDCDYRQLASQLVGQGAPRTGLMEELCNKPLVPCFLPNCQQTCASDSTDRNICISAIFRLNSDEHHHAAALSAVSDELSLWDFTTGKCVKGNTSISQVGKKIMEINTIVYICHDQC